MKRLSRRWTSAVALIMVLVMVFPMNAMAGTGIEIQQDTDFSGLIQTDGPRGVFVSNPAGPQATLVNTGTSEETDEQRQQRLDEEQKQVLRANLNEQYGSDSQIVGDKFVFTSSNKQVVNIANQGKIIQSYSIDELVDSLLKTSRMNWLVKLWKLN